MYTFLDGTKIQKHPIISTRYKLTSKFPMETCDYCEMANTIIKMTDAKIIKPNIPQQHVFFRYKYKPWYMVATD